MYSDEGLIPISTLNHFLYCQRRCALIHIEQTWNENLFTAEGRIIHERAHEQGQESRGNIRIERGLPLRSLRLGLIGKADVVEFHRRDDNCWRPFPVEYKRGKPKRDDCDKVQLCAQAMCLEEMLGTEVPAGALYYGKTRHRLDVAIDQALQNETQMTAQKVHELIRSGITPKAAYAKKCKSCSLIDRCLPQVVQKKRSVMTYLKKMTEEE